MRDKIALRLQGPERIEPRLLEQRLQIVVVINFFVLVGDHRQRRLGDHRLRQRIRDLLLPGGGNALPQNPVFVLTGP